MIFIYTYLVEILCMIIETYPDHPLYSLSMEGTISIRIKWEFLDQFADW